MGTVLKELLQPPTLLAVIPLATGMPSQVTVIFASEAAKPLPVTVTTVPAAPMAGDMFIRGFTVKVEDAETLVVVSSRKTLCVPLAAAGMGKKTLTLVPEAAPDWRIGPVLVSQRTRNAPLLVSIVPDRETVVPT